MSSSNMQNSLELNFQCFHGIMKLVDSQSKKTRGSREKYGYGKR